MTIPRDLSQAASMIFELNRPRPKRKFDHA